MAFFQTIVYGMMATVSITGSSLGKVGIWFHGLVRSHYHINSTQSGGSDANGKYTVPPMFTAKLRLMDKIRSVKNINIACNHAVTIDRLRKKIDPISRKIVERYFTIVGSLDEIVKELICSNVGDLERMIIDINLESLRKKWNSFKDNESKHIKAVNNAMIRYMDANALVRKIKKSIVIRKKIDALLEFVVDKVHVYNPKSCINVNQVTHKGFSLNILPPNSFMSVTIKVSEKRKRELKLSSDVIKFKMYTVGESGNGLPSKIEVWVNKRAGAELVSDVNQFLLLFAVKADLPPTAIVHAFNQFQIYDHRLVADTCNTVIKHQMANVRTVINDIKRCPEPERLEAIMGKYESQDISEKVMMEATSQEVVLTQSKIKKCENALRIAKCYYDHQLSTTPIVDSHELMSLADNVRKNFHPSISVLINSVVFINNLELFMEMAARTDPGMRRDIMLKMESDGQPIQELMNMDESNIRAFFIRTIERFEAYPLLSNYIVCVYMNMLKQKSIPPKMRNIRYIEDSIRNPIDSLEIQMVD